MKINSVFLLYIVLFFTIMSQCPPFFNTQVGSIFQMIWIVFIPDFFRGLIKYRFLFPLILFSFFAIIILRFLAGVSISSDTIFDVLDLLRNYIITFFMIFVGASLADKIKLDAFYYILWLNSLITLPIICFSLYILYFKDYDFTNRVYAYYGKNSIALIILTNMFFIVFKRKSNKKIINFLSAIVVFICIIILFYLRSRASLLCLLTILPALYMWFRVEKKKLKVIVPVLVFSGILIYVLFNKDINFIIDNFILAGRDATDINDVSSGRIDQYERIFLLEGHYIFGLGKTAPLIDNFYLYNPLVYGIPSFVLTLVYMFVPIKIAKEKFIRKHSLGIGFIFILVSFYIIASFEGVAPLGPGVRCFILWLLTGYLIVKNEKFSAYINRRRFLEDKQSFQ